MYQNLGQITNATKAQLIVSLNEILGLLALFHVVLTTTQLAGIDMAANGALGAFVALTYTQSAKRVDPPAPGPETK